MDFNAISADEIKRQGCLIGQPTGKYSAWLLCEQYLVIIDEAKNEYLAIFDTKDISRRVFIDLNAVGEAILVAAGVR